MEKNVSSFVERYQLLYEKDPKSKVFAPLAEAYRRMGLVDEAIDLAKKGVKHHPHFASGRVALGKCFVQKEAFDKALEQLKVAVELSPENLLAHQLLAECYARLNKPSDALNAYKMVLFLNPKDVRVAQIVKKLEEDVFLPQEVEILEDFSMEHIEEMKPSKKAAATPQTSNKKDPKDESKIQIDERDFERELALLDTRFERGDWSSAQKHLEELLRKFPNNAELLQRQHYMNELSQTSFHMSDFLAPLKTDLNKPKIEKLKTLLDRISDRRKA